MTGAILIASVLITAAVIIRMMHAPAPAPAVKRWVDGEFGWSVASHSDGRYVHILPEGDGQVHTEDHTGDCACGPSINEFERTSGGTGRLIIHRTSSAEARR